MQTHPLSVITSMYVRNAFSQLLSIRYRRILASLGHEYPIAQTLQKGVIVAAWLSGHLDIEVFYANSSKAD